MFCRLMNSLGQRRLVRAAVPGILAFGVAFVFENVQAQSNVPMREVRMETNTLPLLISNFESGTNIPQLALQPLTNVIVNTNNPPDSVRNIVTATNVVPTPAVTNFLESSNVRDFTNVAFLTATNTASTATSAPPPKSWRQRVHDWWKGKS